MTFEELKAWHARKALDFKTWQKVSRGTRAERDARAREETKMELHHERRTRAMAAYATAPSC